MTFSELIILLVSVVLLVAIPAVDAMARRRKSEESASDKCPFCLSERDPERPMEQWKCGTLINGWDRLAGSGVVVRSRRCVDYQEFDDHWRAQRIAILRNRPLPKKDWRRH